MVLTCEKSMLLTTCLCLNSCSSLPVVAHHSLAVKSPAQSTTHHHHDRELYKHLVICSQLNLVCRHLDSILPAAVAATVLVRLSTFADQTTTRKHIDRPSGQ